MCALAWSDDPRARRCTQTGLAVSAGDGRWTLINASPDLSEQIRRTPALHPNGVPRGSPIDAVVLTGGEIDQVAGLLSLREGAPLTLLATRETHAAVSANAMFSALTRMERRTLRLGATFPLASGIEAELFAVPGKAPLYLEGEKPELQREGEANVGVELRYGGTRLEFVPGAVAVTADMHARFARADAILFDGTLFTDDEMLRLKVGEKTGRRMGHMPISGDGGSLHAFDGLAARRIYLHINNTNPIHISGSPERRMVEATGWEIANDGMEIVL